MTTKTFTFQIFSFFLFFSCCLVTLNSQVVINEFSAANFNAVFDEYGDDPDWIELYNNDNVEVDLSGYFLSDRLTNVDKFEIPTGVTIAAQGYLLVYCSGRDEWNGISLHTNFKLKQTRNPEAVVISDPSQNILDSNPMDIPNKVNESRGKLTNGGTDWGVYTDPTPGFANGNNGFVEYAAEPIVSPDPGYYAAPVMVNLSSSEPDITIHYTTNGLFPNASSAVYTEPFEVDETTVVQAIAVSSNSQILSSHTEVNTYFVGDDQHTIPVVSIAGGQSLIELLEGSYSNPTGSLEYFDADANLMDEGLGIFNKHGNDSWAYPQRGIDYISRDEFGIDDEVSHQIFALKDRSKFQRLIFKAAANDNYPYEDGAHIRDSYVHTLSQLADLEMDERTHQSVILYVNGQYWGVYDCREKVDDNDFTSYYYDQGKEWIDFIKTWGNTWYEYGDGADWDDLVDFILNNDMTDDANYQYVEGELEVLSLIDYMILHAHIVSQDWLNWNTGWWRGRKPEGEAKKWRYILWDEDATFGHYINYTGVPDPSPLADPCNPSLLNDPGGQGHIPILNVLLENEDFFALYINRYADLNNNFFNCDFMIGLLDEMIGVIAPEMPRQIDRWGGNVAEWEGNVQELRDFIEDRCEIIDNAIVDCYEDEGLTGPFDILINVQPAGTGKVKANTIIGQNYPWDATYFGGIEVTFEAIPEEFYQFSYWEVNNNLFTPDEFASAITMSLESGDEITAFFVFAQPCAAPFNLTVDTSQYSSAYLEWIGPENFISYQVDYRKFGETDWEINSTLETDYVLYDLEECTMYEVQVRSICPIGISSFSEFTFTSACVGPTGTKDIQDDVLSQLNVFPNPFTNYIMLDFKLAESSDVNIELFSINGQHILSQNQLSLLVGEHNMKVEVDQTLSQGIYLLKVTSKEGSVIKRVVKR